MSISPSCYMRLLLQSCQVYLASCAQLKHVMEPSVQAQAAALAAVTHCTGAYSQHHLPVYQQANEFACKGCVCVRACVRVRVRVCKFTYARLPKQAYLCKLP